MKRLWRVISVAALCAVAARAQSPLLVGYQKSIQVSVPGATAAYSLDSTIAEAGAANGVVEIQGRAPGATNIIVVTSAGTQVLAVVVLPLLTAVLSGGRSSGVRAAGTGRRYLGARLIRGALYL